MPVGLVLGQLTIFLNLHELFRPQTSFSIFIISINSRSIGTMTYYVILQQYYMKNTKIKYIKRTNIHIDYCNNL